jgi:hypothetical protein
MPSRFLSKKTKEIKTYKAIILLVVLYGCETWSLTLRKGHRLRVSENSALREIFRKRGRKWRETREECIMRSFITCTLHQLLLE